MEDERAITVVYLMMQTETSCCKGAERSDCRDTNVHTLLARQVAVSRPSSVCGKGWWILVVVVVVEEMESGGARARPKHAEFRRLGEKHLS